MVKLQEDKDCLRCLARSLGTRFQPVKCNIMQITRKQIKKINASYSLEAGLEKSSVLPVLDQFLSLKTDFVLNRKQKNRSIKKSFFFFFSPIKKTVYNSYLSRQFTVNFTPFNTLSCSIRLYTHMYYMTLGCHQLITPMSE